MNDVWKKNFSENPPLIKEIGKKRADWIVSDLKKISQVRFEYDTETASNITIISAQSRSFKFFFVLFKIFFEIKLLKSNSIIICNFLAEVKINIDQGSYIISFFWKADALASFSFLIEIIQVYSSF